jgi:predicted DsbA family dithiol-disulfide isomerase
MKVEIWSDVVCPFCYLGKRRFEKALDLFSHKDEVEVEWHSFLLDPHIQHTPGMSIHEYLAGKKAVSVEEAKLLHLKMAERVKESDLYYDFDKIIPANTFDAHRLIQYAKSQGLQEQAEERLFHAYFSEGKNIGDRTTLAMLGSEIGLDKGNTSSMLDGIQFTEEVERDLYEAHSIGVQGVPYFVFNSKYAISGAQASELFLGALSRTWKDIQEAYHIEAGKN